LDVAVVVVGGAKAMVFLLLMMGDFIDFISTNDEIVNAILFAVVRFDFWPFSNKFYDDLLSVNASLKALNNFFSYLLSFII